MVFLAVSAAGGVEMAQAGCGSLRVDGQHFVFYKGGGITCKKAKGLARRTYRTNKPPRGWKCPDASPGNNRRDGAQCNQPRTGFYFGYHVFD
jgi:hypothetical protein